MLLYVIEAEVLASFINANKSMKGIQTGDYENKMIYFADNTTIFLILLSLGGKGVWGGRVVIFARGRCKFKLFLNGLWYGPETL